jgi:adhesin/invasin
MGLSGRVPLPFWNVERGWNRRTGFQFRRASMICNSQSLHRILTILALTLGGQGCKSDNGNGPQVPPLEIAKTPTLTGDSSSWSTGHNIPNPMRVVVTRGGEPVAGVEVTWQADPGGSILTPVIGITGSDGISTARWTLGTEARDYHGEASVDSAEGSPVRFTAYAYPNFPHQMHLVGGDGQIAIAGTTLPLPLQVMVGDQFNNPYPGTQVEWLIISGQGTLSNTLSSTDDDGVASASLTLGPTPGDVTVLARFPNADTGPRITFTATATP